jgi:hypothetical protein
MTRLVLFTGLVLLAGSVQAQTPAGFTASRSADAQIHRLEILDGAVYHDGEALPAGALPQGLDIDGMSMSFEYSGPVAPAIGLNGRIYALDGDRLVELNEEDLDQQAFALSRPEPVSVSAARQAEQAYMQGLSERDRVLYERIIREREMEAEALALARTLRQNPNVPNQATLRSQLREKLSAMFELKQENRREEARQVEDVLEALRQRLQEREAMREEIIQHRMRELTGQ